MAFKDEVPVSPMKLQKGAELDRLRRELVDRLDRHPMVSWPGSILRAVVAVLDCVPEHVFVPPEPLQRRLTLIR